MQFQRLRISGFKSFVDAVEVRIEPGLTGVVGPNGCGKSNLLEALRWVMGASSAKSLRAGGMDEVIFGGSGARPARNHAEVKLEIDNAERRAPAPFNGEAVIEVARRIDRSAGSTYRVNGVEVRARDVQLLFADASTGANSPSLVRQGQISELIAAKPSNRRRILEEAAGVSGLHTRRHEADLRLSGAEANMARLDDVARELEGALNRLKREARQAEKYRRLAADIRLVQAAALHGRWREAADALAAAQGAADEAVRRAGETAGAAARGAAEAVAAAEALPPLREEETVAAAVLARLTIERDRAERDAALAEADVERLDAEAARLRADLQREGQLAEEARAAGGRADRDLAEIDRALARPSPEPELEAALAAAGRNRAEADAAVERAAAAAAAETERRRAALARRDALDAALRAAAGREAAAAARRARAAAALSAAEAERAALAVVDPARGSTDREALVRAETALAAARSALEAAEGEAAAAQLAEAAARDLSRTAEDALRRARTEAQGLAQLARPARATGAPPALDRTVPARGYEAAVAAAFGEELEAALDPAAPAHWREGAPVPAPAWPTGAAPLAAHVEAPPALAARLALTALVDRADGGRLAREVPPGARLVSREGDLWRWDGFTSRADAPRPATRRLEQRARLREIENELLRLAPEAQTHAERHAAAAARLLAAQAALKPARAAPASAERALAPAREAVERGAREAAGREARASALDEASARLRADVDEAGAALATAAAELAGARDARDAAASDPPPNAGGDPLAGARTLAARAREAEAGARAALDVERRAREGRGRRREALAREAQDWARRAAAAAARLAALQAEAGRGREALRVAREALETAGPRRAALLDRFGDAQARRGRAADAWTAAERRSADADRALRAAEAAAGEARERRAAAEARLEPARDRLEETAAELRRVTGVEPEALARRLAAEAVALPAGAPALDAHLLALERERDGLGAVNLRAAEEAAEQAARLDVLARERADLQGAVLKLRDAIEALNAEGRERLLAAFARIDESFRSLFATLFEGGQGELRLVESTDALEAGLEIYATPPGKRLSTLSLMSGGEQALTACALIFAVFLANPSPVCVLDEVDAPLDDANVDRFCRLLDEMRRRTSTRFLAITHNPVTMSRMDRLLGVTMAERGVSQLVSVDLARAEALAAS